MDYLGKHISGQFDAELASVRSQLMTMGGLVEQQLSQAVESLIKHDLVLADQVIDNDHKINLLEINIDEECVKIIAKRQPTASDLRLIMVILKAISELERIGDGAKAISKTAKESFTESEQTMIMGLENMAHNVMNMLHNVLDAFTRMDMDMALNIYKEDKKIAQNQDLVIRQLMTFMMEDPRSIPNILRVLNCARSLMRISSRCQNICELIFYFVKGKNFRHLGDVAIDDLLE